MEHATDTYHMISLSDREYSTLKEVLGTAAIDPTFPERHPANALGHRLFPDDQPDWVIESLAERQARVGSNPTVLAGLQRTITRQAQVIADEREKVAERDDDIAKQERTEEALTALLEAAEATIRGRVEEHQQVVRNLEQSVADLRLRYTLAVQRAQAAEKAAAARKPDIDHDPIHGIVQDAGGGVFTVLVDRDTETYPADGMRGYWAAEGTILEGTPESREIERLRHVVRKRNEVLLGYQHISRRSAWLSTADTGTTRERQ